VGEFKTWQTEIDSHRATYHKPFQVYLDFFFLPCESTSALRKAFYEMLHGHPYDSGAVKAAERRVRKEMTGKPSAPPTARPLKGKK
jgi:hypothetical protein